MSAEATPPQPIQPAQTQAQGSAGPSAAQTQQPQPQTNGTTAATTSNTNGNNAPGDENKEAQDQSDIELTKLFTARREEDMARRDRTLAEFLVMLDGYKPLIPEEVTEYYLQKSGFDCSDPRLKRLLSLSAQKFVSDLSRDAYHFAKLRVNGTTARGRPVPADRGKVVLTMDDLSLALGEHGVNARKPDYCKSTSISSRMISADILDL